MASVLYKITKKISRVRCVLWKKHQAFLTNYLTFLLFCSLSFSSLHTVILWYRIYELSFVQYYFEVHQKICLSSFAQKTWHITSKCLEKNGWNQVKKINLFNINKIFLTILRFDYTNITNFYCTYMQYINGLHCFFCWTLPGSKKIMCTFTTCIWEIVDKSSHSIK